MFLHSICICVRFFLFVCLFQSVYGLQNDIRTHSPTHTPAPEAKQPTEEELQEQVNSLTELLNLEPMDHLIRHFSRPDFREMTSLIII